jgi:hypothetical protein
MLAMHVNVPLLGINELSPRVVVPIGVKTAQVLMEANDSGCWLGSKRCAAYPLSLHGRYKQKEVRFT